VSSHKSNKGWYLSLSLSLTRASSFQKVSLPPSPLTMGWPSTALHDTLQVYHLHHDLASRAWLLSADEVVLCGDLRSLLHLLVAAAGILVVMAPCSGVGVPNGWHASPIVAAMISSCNLVNAPSSLVMGLPCSSMLAVIFSSPLARYGWGLFSNWTLVYWWLWCHCLLLVPYTSSTINRP
jgi:hypothetical protein